MPLAASPSYDNGAKTSPSPNKVSVGSMQLMQFNSAQCYLSSKACRVDLWCLGQTETGLNTFWFHQGNLGLIRRQLVLA